MQEIWGPATRLSLASKQGTKKRFSGPRVSQIRSSYKASLSRLVPRRGLSPHILLPALLSLTSRGLCKTLNWA